MSEPLRNKLTVSFRNKENHNCRFISVALSDSFRCPQRIQQKRKQRNQTEKIPALFQCISSLLYVELCLICFFVTFHYVFHCLYKRPPKTMSHKWDRRKKANETEFISSSGSGTGTQGGVQIRTPRKIWVCRFKLGSRGAYIPRFKRSMVEIVFFVFWGGQIYTFFRLVSWRSRSKDHAQAIPEKSQILQFSLPASVTAYVLNQHRRFFGGAELPSKAGFRAQSWIIVKKYLLNSKHHVGCRVWSWNCVSATVESEIKRWRLSAYR